MTDDRQAAGKFRANPHDLQISALAIFHRAMLSAASAQAQAALLEAYEDYLWYSRRQLAEMGEPSPIDETEPTEPGPVVPLFESPQLVCLSQRMAPTIGKDRLHVRLVSPGPIGEGSRYGPTPAAAGALAVAELAQHLDGRWQFLHVEVSGARRRQGLATLLYDRLEACLGAELQPSGWLTDDSYRFWQARGHRFLVHYRQVEHFPGVWISPAALLTLMSIAEARLAELEE